MASSTSSSSSRPLSLHPSLPIAGSIFGAILLGFGANAILRPVDTLSFFAISPPTTPVETKIVTKLLVPLGARDIFAGGALIAASWFGTRKTLGWLYIASAGVGFADGWTCLAEGWGSGEATHFGFIPVLIGAGLVSLGLFD